jgi:hypothetical protein
VTCGFAGKCPLSRDYALPALTAVTRDWPPYRARNAHGKRLSGYVSKIRTLMDDSEIRSGTVEDARSGLEGA